MEKLKKKKKYYFPYKLFNERKSKSQANIFEKDKPTFISTKLISHKNNEVNNFVKKLKSTILSNKIFSKYMDNYIGQTQDFCFKSPENNIYPLKKNYQFLPINFQRSQIIDEPKDQSKKEITNENENEINAVLEKPYGFKYKKTRIIIDKNKDYYHHNSAERIKSKIFMRFSEGNFYTSDLLKTFGLNNIDIINNNEIIKENFQYLHESIINLSSLENYTTSKSIEFKIKNHFNNEDIQFNMDIFSLCFNFYEIKEDPENPDNIQIIKKHKIYLPFKLLPFFYLLNYSYFKNFISEIIYYDIETQSMNFNQDKCGQIFKKYSFYLRNIYQKNNNENFEDITFYKNEFAYQNNYDWIIIKEKDNNKESIIYKMKIVFPKVIFEEKNNKIKVKNHLNKNILIRILKMNFEDWEKLVLFDLFSNKKFRYLINNILIGRKKFIDKTLKLYENRAFDGINTMFTIPTMNKTFTNFNKLNKNYEFFLSETAKMKSFYYIFIPNIILLLTGEENRKFQKINLNLKESRKLYELSEYWGAINTLFKCMYKDEMRNIIHFKLNILEDMPKELYKTIQSKKINMRESMSFKNGNISSASNKEKSNYMRYKSNDLELVLSECLLNKININFNEAKLFYYKVPNPLLYTILTSNDNMKIVDCIIDCYNKIINNENEIDIKSEEIALYKKLQKKRGNSPTDKSKFERHLTLGQNKINPSKTYNKNNTFFLKGKVISHKTLNKKRTFMENQKNNFSNTLKKKNTNILANNFKHKKTVNVSNLNESNDIKMPENDKLPNLPNNKKREENNEDLFRPNNYEGNSLNFSRNLKNFNG